MTRLSTTIGAACAAALLIAGAAVPAANAYYLGYGNGDPGAWDFWTEQNGGRPMEPALGPQVHAAPYVTRHASNHHLHHHASAPARSNVKHS